MNPLQNIVKGWITTCIGTCIIVVALILVALNKLPLYWEASGLMFIGAVFLIVPDKIGVIVDAVIKKKSQ